MTDYDIVKAALEGYRCVSDPLCAQPSDGKTLAACQCLACSALAALKRYALADTLDPARQSRGNSSTAAMPTADNRAKEEV